MNTYNFFGAAAVAGSLIGNIALGAVIENPVDVTDPGLGTTIRLQYGDHTVSSGISPGVDIDGYVFSGNAGDKVRLIMAGSTSFFDPRITLRNSVGDIVSQSSCTGSLTCTTFIDEMLATTGDYFISLSDVGANESGVYTFSLEQYPPANNWYGLAYNTPLTETLGYAGDHDFIGFNGVAGTGIQVNVQGLTSFLDPFLQIWSPSGELIADQGCTGSLTCSIIFTDTLTETGVYRAAILEGGLDETGSYQLSVNCTFGNCNFSAPSPVPLPATFWFFASGLAGLLGIQSRKNSTNKN